MLVIMKMNIAELKAQLSKVVRELQESGDAVEVCVRERPVAYLTPILAGTPETGPAAELDRLAGRLSKVGLTLQAPPPSLEPPLLPRLHTAGDQRIDISTAEAMRSGKGW